MPESIEIIPTCVPADFSALRATIARASFAASLHVDVDDGLFVEALTWPYTESGAFVDIASERFDMPLEIHLMVQSPRAIGEQFAKIGARRLIAHVEAFEDAGHAAETLQAWRDLGVAEAGLSILLDTPLDRLAPLAPFADFAQVMSVSQIGAQGAPFDDRAIARLESIRERYPELRLEADGGVSESSIRELAQAGARRCAAGSAIWNSPDPADAHARLLAVAESGLQYSDGSAERC